MSKRSLLLATSLAAALLLSAGAAHAETFCVSTPGCANHDLPDALDAAADDPGSDRVALGEGTFTREGGFRYFADNATNPVEIAGQGDKTVVRGLPSAYDARLTSLALYGPGSTVRDLRIAVPGTGNMAESAALWLDRNTVEDVTVTLDPDAYGAAIWSTDSTLRRVDAKGTWAAVIAVGPTIEDSRLAGIAGVDIAGSENPTAILRSRIEAKTMGISSGGSVVAVRDSLIRLSQDGIGLRAYNSAGGSVATVDATHVPLAGPGAGIGAKAVGTTSGAIVTFVNGVMTGFKTPAQREKASPAVGSTGVVLSHSVLPAGASGPNVVEDDVLCVDGLQFADAAQGDYPLAAGSPALDRGMDAPPGGLPPADLLGRPRKADGGGGGAAHSDPGAFERPAPPSAGRRRRGRRIHPRRRRRPRAGRRHPRARDLGTARPAPAHPVQPRRAGAGDRHGDAPHEGGPARRARRGGRHRDRAAAPACDPAPRSLPRARPRGRRGRQRRAAGACRVSRQMTH